MKGFSFETIAFKSSDQETMNSFHFGDQYIYGLKALRISRQAVMGELLAAAEERGIAVKFEMKLSQIISENEKSVNFQFADGSSASATYLIGADGIHSRVRNFVARDVTPIYSGQLAIMSLVKRSMMRFPSGIDYPLPTIVYGQRGAFLLVPEDVAGENVLAATQIAFPERDKAGWDDLASSPSETMDLFASNKEQWPDIVRSCLEATNPNKITIWPYYSVPQFKKWYSEANKVILLGDAAHAIPPTGGQGACMAIEDGYTLALLLSKLSAKVPLSKALNWWQIWRQERIEKVLELTKQLGNLRLPAVERERLAMLSNKKQEDLLRDAGGELHWLYSATLKEEVISWIEEHQ